MPVERRRELLRLFRESGLTRSEFARQEGLRYTTFCTWVQQEAKPNAQSTPPETPVRFAEVALPVSAPQGLEVQLPCGAIARGSNAAELAKLIRALRT
jgi:transposase-like protein